jgi:lipid-A-disaccharide synthase
LNILENNQTHIYVICGERSGDLHTSNFLKAYKQQQPNVIFRGIGGELSKSEGLSLLFHYKEISYMGFFEVAKNIVTIFKHINQTKKDILAFKPDAILLVDFSGYNMRIASFCKQHNIKVFYYIAPKVWAWNTKRAYKIKKVVDHMMVILPFEKDFFKKFDYDVTYVGNPLNDAVNQFVINENYVVHKKWSLNKPIVAILPGSRYQEVKMILSNMVEIVPLNPNIQFVIAGVTNLDKSLYEPFLKYPNIDIVFNETYHLLSHARAAVVTSGTATLETALFRVPQVVCYKMSNITYQIAKRIIKVSYISLVNLIANKLLVNELIQESCNSNEINIELQRLINEGDYRSNMLCGYDELIRLVGNEKVSEKASRKMIELMGKG